MAARRLSAESLSCICLIIFIAALRGRRLSFSAALSGLVATRAFVQPQARLRTRTIFKSPWHFFRLFTYHPCLTLSNRSDVDEQRAREQARHRTKGKNESRFAARKWRVAAPVMGSGLPVFAAFPRIRERVSPARQVHSPRTIDDPFELRRETERFFGTAGSFRRGGDSNDEYEFR